MFLFINSQRSIEKEKACSFIGSVNKYLSDFYPHKYISQLINENHIVLKWDNEAGNATNICENNSGWLLEDGLLSYKDSLSESKLQVCLNDYLAGEDITKFIDNHFALLIFDKNRNIYNVYSDVIGSHHFFYIELNGLIAISSSTILLSMLCNLTINDIAINEFLSTGNVFNNNTIYNEINKISNAEVIQIRNAKIVKRTKYWNGLSNIKTNSIYKKTANEYFIQNVDTIINRLSSNKYNIASDLTGGFDSRMILGFLLRNKFKVDYVYSGNIAIDDYRISSIIANEFDLKLSAIKYESEDAKTKLFEKKHRYLAFVTNSMMNILPYLETFNSYINSAKDNAIHLTGSGGEISREYWSEFEYPFVGLRKSLRNKFIVKKHFLNPEINRKYLNNKYKDDLQPHFLDIINSISNEYPDVLNVPKIDYIYLILRMQYWGGAFRSANNHFNPIFTTFLTKDFIKLAFEIHYSLKIKQKLFRSVLNLINEPLSRVQTETGLPYYPFRIKDIMKFAKYYCRNLSRFNKFYNLLFSNSGNSSSLLFKNILLQSALDIIGNTDLGSMNMGFALDEQSWSDLLENSKNIKSTDHILIWRIITLELYMREVDEIKRHVTSNIF